MGTKEKEKDVINHKNQKTSTVTQKADKIFYWLAPWEQQKASHVPPYILVLLVLSSSIRKSSKTVLLHFGHFGLASDSMTYMRHRGHPASTMAFASGLLWYWCSGSDDTQELRSSDMFEDVSEAFGEPIGEWALGGDRFSFNSSFGLVLPLLLIFISHL